MWRPWSRALELLGRFRLRIPAIGRRKGLRVGQPGAPDARGGQGWRGYLRGERLFDVWGPHPDSPWVPFHCVPLFAALDTLDPEQVGPTPPPELAPEAGPAGPAAGDVAAAGSPPGAPAEPRWTGWVPRGAAAPRAEPPPVPAELPRHARPGTPAPRWLGEGTWTILDLPGPLSVEAAAWLVEAAGCQPVCTFDNWPHPKGVLRAEATLAELLRWATTMSELRGRMTRTDPPLWVCDSQRLGTRAGVPGEFDNRYFLDDSILPGPELLRRNAVRRVVYVSLGAADAPLLDFEEYFADLLAGGLPLEWVDLADPALEPRPFAAPRTPRRVTPSSYRRSAAGGFGTEVPQPSSGGGG